MDYAISALTSDGLKILWDYIDEYKRCKKDGLPLPIFPRNHLLQNLSRVIDASIQLSDGEKFADRYQFAVYVNRKIGSKWNDTFLNDVGLWSWLAVLYWDQFTAKGVSRQEHYIPMIGNYHGRLARERIDYRQCTRTPLMLVRRFGKKAEFFMGGKSMAVMGDIIEQTLSRQDIFGNSRFIETIISHFSDSNGHPVAGATSIPAKKKLKTGKWSQAGRGGIRRLVHAYLPRMKLTYNVYALDPNEIIKLAGSEFKRK